MTSPVLSSARKVNIGGHTFAHHDLESMKNHPMLLTNCYHLVRDQVAAHRLDWPKLPVTDRFEAAKMSSPTVSGR